MGCPRLRRKQINLLSIKKIFNTVCYRIEKKLFNHMRNNVTRIVYKTGLIVNKKKKTPFLKRTDSVVNVMQHNVRTWFPGRGKQGRERQRQDHQWGSTIRAEVKQHEALLVMTDVL